MERYKLSPAEHELLKALELRSKQEPDVECAAAAQLIWRLIDVIADLERSILSLEEELQDKGW